jgi:hypothetical protein
MSVAVIDSSLIPGQETQTGASRRDGQELGEALKGVPGNMEVAMADEMSVVLAEVPGRAFVSVGSSFVLGEALPNDSTLLRSAIISQCAGAIDCHGESRSWKRCPADAVLSSEHSG